MGFEGDLAHRQAELDSAVQAFRMVPKEPVSDDPRDLPRLTAAELDRMDPADRVRAIRARQRVLTWDELPPEVAEHFRNSSPPPPHR